MNRNWINIFGIIIMILMLVPNIYFACKNKDAKNKCKNKVMNILEQVGRYGTMFLMCFNIGLAEFGFKSENSFAIWFVTSGVLMSAYWVCWAIFFKRISRAIMLLLAIIPSLIFIISGVILRHWLLLGFALLFAVSYIYVTVKNAV